MYSIDPAIASPRYYEERVQQCLRLGRHCLDYHAIEALARLAEEYGAMAEALRRKEVVQETSGSVSILE